MSTFPTDEITEKHEFLHKYGAIPKTIKANNTCFAISHAWWDNFECLVEIAKMEPDMIMGNPGPINNLPLLQLSEIYSELVSCPADGNFQNHPDPEILAELNDWDHLSLKPTLKYKKDFVIVSSFLWTFLKGRYGGGPEIEFIPEAYPNDAFNSFSNIITPSDEPDFEKNILINLDMIKIYVSKDQDWTVSKAKYVSPTASTQRLLNCLCKDYFLPPNGSAVFIRKGLNYEEIKDHKLAIKDAQIHEGTHVTVCKSNNRAQNDLPTFGTPAEVDNGDNESTKANEDEERSYRHQFGHDSDYEGNYSTNSRDSTDSAKLSTGSTNHRLNPLDFSFSEYVLGDDLPGMNNFNRGDNIEMKELKSQYGIEKPDGVVIKEQVHPHLDVFLKRSKQAVDKQKITLTFKPLQEIRANLLNIQHEWSLWTNLQPQKKI